MRWVTVTHADLLLTFQEIPPFETKGVMRASFSSRDVDNHTAFIRIKTNAPNEDQFIILPVEVEVTSGALVIPVNSFILILSFFSWMINIFLRFCFLQPLVYTPPQRCSTLVHCDHKVKTQRVAVFSGAVCLWASLLILPLLSLPFFCLTDRPKLLNLHLLNSGTKDVPITVGILSSSHF